MRKVKYLSILVITLLSFSSFANHVAGGYFEYKYLGNDTYQIDFVWLRDCAGSTVQSPKLYRNSDCGSTCISLGAMSQVGTVSVVDFGCGNTCPNATPNGMPGYQVYRFRKQVVLPSTCDSWTFSTNISIRNEVTYMIGGDYYYNYCRINNNYNNDSPTVSGSNLIVGCKDYQANALHSFNATDGDQIVYDFVTPYHGYDQTCNKIAVAYESGYNASKSFPSSQNFALNSSTGGFSFTPTGIGKSYYAVRAREYRNGVLIGETVVDGMIYVDNCNVDDHVTFGDFAGSGDNSWTVNGVGPFCETFLLTGEDDSEVSNIYISGSDYITYTISPASDGKKLITLCVEFPPEAQCQEIDLNIVVSATAGGSSCLAATTSASDKGYYQIHKNKGLYCPKNLFFTNRNPAGTIMPTYSRAEEYIYVGDSMPPTAPQPVLDNQGPVISNDHVTMVAGINVIIPACHGATSGCVQLSAGHTIYLKPNSCSSECEEEPLEVSVDKLFNCRAESLKANASGEAPFTYHWNVGGNLFTTYEPSLDVHDIVSEVDGARIPYTVTVYDAVGNTGQASDSTWGTKRFYEPIQDNKDWFNYPPGSIFGESGYYYSANLGVYTDTPAYITDSVNSTPPWYGATGMKLIVYDRFGHPIMVHRVELGGTNDWSMDNGEFYWNGKTGNYPYDGNDPWGACHEGEITDLYQYILYNRNCFQIGSLDDFESDCDEEATFTIFGCLDEDYEYVQTKSMSTGGNDDETQVVTGSSRIPERSAEILRDDYFACFPTPMITEFEIFSSDKLLENVRIIDQTGKTMLTFATVQSGQKINVKHLSAGVYVLVADTDLGERRIKLLKE